MQTNKPIKTRVTIRLDNEVVEFFKKQGEQTEVPYQVLLNRVLREYVVNTKANNMLKPNSSK